MKIFSSALLLVISISMITLSSCGAGDLNKKAIATAESFYTNLQKKNYSAAIDLCSNKAFATDSKADWTKSLEKNNILLGNIQSFTKVSGFNISTSTSTGTQVTVAYDVQWQYGKSRDSLTLIKDNDGIMRVYNYRWDHQSAKYLEEITASAKQASDYMAAVKNKDYDAAIGFCSDEALKLTPKENWKLFLDKAAAQMGPLTSYSVMRDSSYYHIEGNGEAGKGNYYDIYMKSHRGNNDVTEKIVFFQKDYQQPVKLVGHTFP